MTNGTATRQVPERDPGFWRAIEAAGGVVALSRLAGVKHPTVSRWRRVPARHVIPLERALSGVTRQQMRPDLYPND